MACTHPGEQGGQGETPRKDAGGDTGMAADDGQGEKPGHGEPGMPANEAAMRSMPSCSATATARTSQSGRAPAIASSEPRMYRPMPVGGTLSGVTSQATRTL